MRLKYVHGLWGREEVIDLAMAADAAWCWSPCINRLLRCRGLGVDILVVVMPQSVELTRDLLADMAICVGCRLVHLCAC